MATSELTCTDDQWHELLKLANSSAPMVIVPQDALKALVADHTMLDKDFNFGDLVPKAPRSDSKTFTADRALLMKLIINHGRRLEKTFFFQMDKRSKAKVEKGVITAIEITNPGPIEHVDLKVVVSEDAGAFSEFLS